MFLENINLNKRKIAGFLFLFCFSIFGHDYEPLGYFSDKDGKFERKMWTYICKGCEAVCVDRLMTKNITSDSPGVLEFAPLFATFTDHDPFILGISGQFKADTGAKFYAAVLYPEDDYPETKRWSTVLLGSLDPNSAPSFRVSHVSETLYRVEYSTDNKTWNRLHLEHTERGWVSQTKIGNVLPGTQLPLSPLLQPGSAVFNWSDLSIKIWPNRPDSTRKNPIPVFKVNLEVGLMPSK